MTILLAIVTWRDNIRKPSHELRSLKCTVRDAQDKKIRCISGIL